MKNSFPQIKIFNAPYPEVTTRIIELFCTGTTRPFLSRRDFTRLLPGAKTDHIRKTLADMLANKILARSGARYRLAISPSVIAGMTPLRFYKVDLLILRLIHDRKQITAGDVFRLHGISRTIFLKSVSRLISRDLIESYQEKPSTATRRYYRFKSKEIIHE